MKKIITLTESELVDLIKKTINEQHMDESHVEEYLKAIDEIANMVMDDEISHEEIESLIDEISHIMDSAHSDEDLSDDDVEDVFHYGQGVISELESMIGDSDEFLQEGTKAKKPRPMKSKRSGVKTQERINKNHEVLKKLMKEDINLDIEDEDGDEEEIVSKHSHMGRHMGHSDPNEFTLIGKIQRNRFRQQFREKDYPHFVLRTRNKTEDGTGILGGKELEGYEDRVVKITGITKNGQRPSFQNPIKLTKRPQILSR